MKLLRFLLALFWLAIWVVQFLVWNVQVRYVVLGQKPVLELAISSLNDVIWIPVGLALLLYIAALAYKLLTFKGRLIVWILGGLFVLALVLLNLPAYFRFMIVPILLFWVLLIWKLIQSKRMPIDVLMFTIVLLSVVFYYNSQLLPNLTSESNRRELKLLSVNIGLSMPKEQHMKLIERILQDEPDIVFIQEFRRAQKQYFQKALAQTYPYQTWSSNTTNYLGGAILSKIPFQHKETIKLQTSFETSRTNINYAVIRLEDQPVHLINCHFSHGGHQILLGLRGKKPMDRSLQSAAQGFVRHVEEAEEVNQLLNTIQEPLILAGDMNDTPNSFVYRLFSGKLANAFAEKGWGLGTTYGEYSLSHMFPELRPLLFDVFRIDHVFCSSHFRIQNARVLPVAYSDHKPLVASVSLKKGKNHE